ncbi:universal stress protein [Palleronia pelagia]|uniref:Nucleotide-binding universal stress protein, UspA family n=1 Tax=Palleronia pelagia TaxID=387096 RepID=A0A1H8GIU0_9RHOB|nr:universal stress protein [Palleronia pelagia]SEN43228.1 Nucleotide-binding universal stress protein, UspA family [Palleronia pelagia]
MAQETFVVAYDDNTEDTAVLDCAISRASRSGARLVIVHVLEWSPYSFLTQQELEERHKKRTQELDRAHKHVLDPAIAKAKEAGVEAVGTVQHGSAAELVVKTANEEKASFIFVGRSGSSAARARIFGSIPLAIAQIATVPTVIVP